MADELDQLLDEVERRFCRMPDRGATGGGQNGDRERAAAEDRSAKTLMGAGSDEDDIDDIIDEICNDSSSFARTPLKLKSNSPSVTPGSNSTVVQAQRKRCCPVYLGGSSSPNGIGTNISKRNNMPELSKLRAKMIKKKGSRAYACQCSWRSIDELTDLQADQQLRYWCHLGDSYFTFCAGSVNVVRANV
ncbi:cilia- and flagella-associated protein 418 isoform X5 [Gallus gallus]|uniref:cilia- and flagella-associated protein 418 isoform X5 n=1 Tax=Gallus gallus TaxID=9031 RepID=UPI001AE44785|nr:cilia- and flagella-associated protein 418 isoform X5 [Gallus gallus]